MFRPKVLLVSFAPKHSSSLNRIADCVGGSFDLEVYDSATDKVTETIGQRLFSMKFPKLLISLMRSDADVLWAWGLDACFLVTLAALMKPSVRLIWDITDLNPRVLARGFGAALLRKAEWTLLKRANLLLLTSEAFYDNYYCGHIDRDRVKIIENLLPGAPGTIGEVQALAPCIIVFSGIFRSLVVLRVLRHVAELMEGKVVFHLHGYPDRTIPLDTFNEVVGGCSWVHFFGRFKPEELPAIYDRAHLTWAFVDPEANDNERWLLTNRIYNAVAFGRPALANSEVYIGEVVSSRGIGVTCRLDAVEIAAAIRGLVENGGEGYRNLKKLMPLPQSAYLAGHYRELIDRFLIGGSKLGRIGHSVN